MERHSGSQSLRKSTGYKPRIVVIGAGFAGLNTVKCLKHVDAEVVLIDQCNYHLFQPMLYQVATAELDPTDIAEPVRRIFRRQKNVQVALGEVTDIDLQRKVLCFDGGEMDYDYLVIATGARQSYFGHDEFRQHAPCLKTLDDALEIRRRLLLAFEEAEWEADPDARRAKLTFVIVGGGPTGIELAGAIQDVASNTLPSEFRNVDTTTARVILVQGGSRLVPGMPEDLAVRAQHVLERLGVEIRLNSRVTKVTDEGVMVGEELIAAENVIWAAGVQGQTLAGKLAREHGIEVDRCGRVLVGPDLAIPEHREVLVVGDAASMLDTSTGESVPGVAQGAIQSGRFAATIIKQELADSGSESRRFDNRPAFRYFDKGSMAMIGRGRAIAAIGRMHFGGMIGWLAWGLVHVMFLIGFGNKIKVMTQWFWNYIRHTRRARLITGNPAVHIRQVLGLREEESKAIVKAKTTGHDEHDPVAMDVR